MADLDSCVPNSSDESCTGSKTNSDKQLKWLKSSWCFRQRLRVQRSVLEQVGQDETRRFGFHAVNPEVSTAGVVLVTSVHQLEVVRLRIKGLQRICARQGEKKLIERIKSVGRRVGVELLGLSFQGGFKSMFQVQYKLSFFFTQYINTISIIGRC